MWLILLSFCLVPPGTGFRVVFIIIVCMLGFLYVYFLLAVLSFSIGNPKHSHKCLILAPTPSKTIVDVLLASCRCCLPYHMCKHSSIIAVFDKQYCHSFSIYTQWPFCASLVYTFQASFSIEIKIATL